MAKTSVNKLKIGMVLDSDVRDVTGRLLLGGGAEITEKHINVFRTWGVIEVDIKGIGEDKNGPECSLDIDPELLYNAEKELEDIFCHTDPASPIIKELFRLSLQHKINAMSQRNKNAC